MVSKVKDQCVMSEERSIKKKTLKRNRNLLIETGTGEGSNSQVKERKKSRARAQIDKAENLQNKIQGLAAGVDKKLDSRPSGFGSEKLPETRPRFFSEGFVRDISHPVDPDFIGGGKLETPDSKNAKPKPSDSEISGVMQEIFMKSKELAGLIEKFTGLEDGVQ